MRRMGAKAGAIAGRLLGDCGECWVSVGSCRPWGREGRSFGYCKRDVMAAHPAIATPNDPFFRILTNHIVYSANVRKVYHLN